MARFHSILLSVLYLGLSAFSVVAAALQYAPWAMLGAEIATLAIQFAVLRKLQWSNPFAAWVFYLAWHCVIVAGAVVVFFLAEPLWVKLQLAVFLLLMFVAMPRRMFGST